MSMSCFTLLQWLVAPLAFEIKMGSDAGLAGGRGRACLAAVKTKAPGT